MPTPPQELRRAADLLEAARVSTSPHDVAEKLAEVRAICARTVLAIDERADPLVQVAGRVVGRLLRPV